MIARIETPWSHNEQREHYQTVTGRLVSDLHPLKTGVEEARTFPTLILGSQLGLLSLTIRVLRGI